MSKLVWERIGDSRDLRLVNPEDFDKAEYKRVLSKFILMCDPGDNLKADLVAFGEEPDNTILTCGENRFGYAGLNRWCTTEGKQYSDDQVFVACKVWKFLFDQSHPPTLVRPLGQSGIALNEAKWNSWYKTVSES